MLVGTKVVSPWNENLFRGYDDTPMIVFKQECGVSHHDGSRFVFMQAGSSLFCPAIAYLITRVTCATEADQDDEALRAYGAGILRWHVDAAASFCVILCFQGNPIRCVTLYFR
jgi:hypothetical protein